MRTHSLSVYAYPDWGGRPFEDIMKGVKHTLMHNEWIDPERVGALGTQRLEPCSRATARTDLA
jgi:hypothetical protein